MENRTRKKQQLLLEAREIFVDANEYDEYELIGYCRLIKALCKKDKEKTSEKIQISYVLNVLKALDKRRCDILRWRYWDGYTRDAIGRILNISGERVRQLESKAINRLKYVFKETDGDDTGIEVLNLEVRSYLALKRYGINTVEQLVKLTPQELLEVKRVGRAALGDIKQKLACYMQYVDAEDQSAFEDMPIDALRFSIRVENALKKEGILYVKQLFPMTGEEIYKIRGIGTKGLNEIMRKKQDRFCKL